MLKRLSIRTLPLPIVHIAQILLLVGLGLLLRAGSGPLANSNHLPVSSDLYIVLVR